MVRGSWLAGESCLLVLGGLLGELYIRAGGIAVGAGLSGELLGGEPGKSCIKRSQNARTIASILNSIWFRRHGPFV